MRKNSTDETVLDTNTENNEPAPTGEEIAAPSPVAATKNTQVNFNFTDEAAQEDDMNPVRDILAAGETESDEMMGMEIELLTVEEVATFLKCTYDVQGWVTFPELWKREPQFFEDIAAGILPQINAWASRFPAVAHAVKTVSAAGSWGRLIWDISGTWVTVVRRRQLEAQKKLEEQENNQNGYKINYSNQQQQQPVNTTQLGTKKGFIIP